jgi:flavin reductase (DIM6/NTAB) family NADH-FMN oxidoreductase RutF
MKDSELKKEFLDSMRGVASAVNVISSQYEDVKHAMTASSIVSLSLDPPSMLVCVNKKASIHQILEKERFFCINILAKDQIDLANLCSSVGNEDSRFNSEEWSLSKGMPYNTESSANIFCRCFDSFSYTSHTVFFGEVVEVINNNKEGPLMYGGGKYLV